EGSSAPPGSPSSHMALISASLAAFAAAALVAFADFADCLTPFVSFSTDAARSLALAAATAFSASVGSAFVVMLMDGAVAVPAAVAAAAVIIAAVGPPKLTDLVT